MWIFKVKSWKVGKCGMFGKYINTSCFCTTNKSHTIETKTIVPIWTVRGYNISEWSGHKYVACAQRTSHTDEETPGTARSKPIETHSATVNLFYPVPLHIQFIIVFSVSHKFSFLLLFGPNLHFTHENYWAQRTSFSNVLQKCRIYNRIFIHFVRTLIFVKQ